MRPRFHDSLNTLSAFSWGNDNSKQLHFNSGKPKGVRGCFACCWNTISSGIKSYTFLYSEGGKSSDVSDSLEEYTHTVKGGSYPLVERVDLPRASQTSSSDPLHEFKWQLAGPRAQHMKSWLQPPREREARPPPPSPLASCCPPGPPSTTPHSQPSAPEPGCGC